MSKPELAPQTSQTRQMPAPPVPLKAENTGLDFGFLADLTLKTVYADANCTTERAARKAAREGTLGLPPDASDTRNEAVLRKTLAGARFLYNPSCEGAPRPQIPMPLEWGRGPQTKHQTAGFNLAVAKVSGQPTGCEIFYEIQLRFIDPNPGNPSLPPSRIVTMVFSGSEDLLTEPRRAVFGLPSKPYPEFYTPKPYSKSYVLHLDAWYAQSHPDEDFAETFAVWLTPNSEWRQRYAGWPALKKLEYMDTLMQSLRGQPPRVQNVAEVDPLRRLRKTLRQHYRNKRRHYGVDYPNFYDRDLRRLFSDAPEFSGNAAASQFIARIRKPVRRVVAGWTGIYQYTIDQVIEDMIARCRELKLRLAVPEDQARQEFTVLLTVQAMNYLHSGGHRLFL